MDWCWSWNSGTLATWCEELTHLKRPQCWERLKVGGEGNNRGWNDWMASLIQWTWVWVNSWSWQWTGRPDVLQSMGSQRVRHDWVTELNWGSRGGFALTRLQEGVKTGPQKLVSFQVFSGDRDILPTCGTGIVFSSRLEVYVAMSTMNSESSPDQTESYSQRALS